MDLKSKYLAFKLSEGSKQNLKDLYPPKFSKVYCDHITVAFNLTEELYIQLTSQYAEAKLLVIGYAFNGESLECFVVSVDGSTNRPDGDTFHITHSLSAPSAPKDSNALIKSVGYKTLNRFMPIQAELVLLNK